MEKCETKTVKCGCSKKCKDKGFKSVLGAEMLEKSGDVLGAGASLDFGEELEAVSYTHLRAHET